ncbi:hypothetical protein NGTWS0302_21910 [Mycolicibacterium cyprinidarum]|uniref:Uncharacterized protein n=1 Tax=Mycolicibacterium cyprinidarum TaxID=2860311 RepID=A0ABQ4V346_9MYCO|nr:hypothetical protein NGTWS0302_21910 [Mycolicibacterium sp. NGTWS0302]GJF08846.1 hypothetical protein NGTWS1702_02160 [Mycolicibacterium sp. NGTWSNA01]
MDTQPQPRVLTDIGGIVVTDDGRRVNVIDRATGGLSTLAFVLGVISLVVGGFGAVALVTATPSRALGGIFLVIGLAVATTTALVVRRIKRRRTQPLGRCRSVAVLDRKLGVFTMAGGALIPLGQVSFARRMQLGSSSPKLVAITPGGVYILKRGNPFEGSIGRVDEVLNDVVRGSIR